jgi:hypothetical protein
MSIMPKDSPPVKPGGAKGRAQTSDPGDRPSVDDITRWLSVLHPADHAIEIRAPETRVPASNDTVNVVRRFAPGQFRKAASEAYKLSGGAPAVYVVLNGIDPSLPLTGPMRGGATAKNIPVRLRVLVDTDPNREGTCSATDDEKASGVAVGAQIRADLRARGWPEPLVGDSGNGDHSVYAIHLPPDNASANLIQAFLAALAARYDTDAVHIDQKVFDAPRLVKLYGTLAAKGENTPERPYRYARVLSAPATLETVTESQLRTVVAELTPAPAPQQGFDLAEEIERKRQRREPEPGAAGFRVPDTAALPDVEARAIKYLEKCEPSVSGKRGHDKAIKAACKIGPGFDLPPATALRLLREDFNPRCEPPWSEKELEHKVSEAYKIETRRGWLKDEPPKNGRANGRHSAGGSGQPPPGENSSPPPGDDRAVISLTADLHKTVDASAAALVARDSVFTRAAELVHVVKHKANGGEPKGVRRAEGTPIICAMGEATARTMLSRVARFRRWDARAKDWLWTTPPRDIAAAVLGLREYPDARDLAGVIEAPTVRPDGSLLREPGYDAATGFLYVPSAVYPAIPDRPTKAEAQAAAEKLLYVACDFPFETEHDKAAWLSSVLSVVGRGGIAGPVPAFLATANVAGTGKSRLAELAGLIATGRAPAADGYVADDAEMDKRLTSVAIAGDRCVVFDNAQSGSAVGCPSLDRAVTARGAYRGRILGASKMSPDIPWTAILFITGNNLSTREDALRRFVPIFLHSEQEHPEERKPEEFKVYKDTRLELRAYVEANRPALVAAALTIIRAYVVAGRPREDLTPMDFPEWDRLIRQAVYFATGIDPCGSRPRLAADDQNSADREQLVIAWATLCATVEKTGGMTTGEAAQQLRDWQRLGLYCEVTERFAQWAKTGNPLPDSRGLGYLLRRHRKAPTKFGCLESTPPQGGQLKWYVRSQN